MSWKYPHQDGGRNKVVNRERQRYSHVVDYHTRHMMRENAERAAAIRAARGAPAAPPPASPAPVSQGAGAGAGLGMLAAAGEVIAGASAAEIIIAIAVVAAVGYGCWRLYKWVRVDPATVA